MKLVMTMVFSLTVFALYPTYGFFVLKEKVLVMNIILPFLDPSTTRGFYINSAHLLFVSFFGILGNIGIELINCIIINNLNVGVDIVSFACNKLNSNLKAIKSYSVNLKRQFRNIFVQVQDLDRCVINVKLDNA